MLSPLLSSEKEACCTTQRFEDKEWSQEEAEKAVLRHLVMRGYDSTCIGTCNIGLDYQVMLRFLCVAKNRGQCTKFLSQKGKDAEGCCWYCSLTLLMYGMMVLSKLFYSAGNCEGPMSLSRHQV